MKFKKIILSISLFVSTAFAGTFNLEETKKLANQGDAKAQYELGYAYYYGEGVPENEERGIEWLLYSAKQGNADAQYELGAALYDENIKGSDKQPTVVEWLTKSANQNNADAQFF